jgi:hypothetical protein
MRVAMCIVAVLVVTTPSEASKSCMTKAEARQQFGSVHIYWHGPAHCWDATRHDAKSSKRSSKKLPPVKTLPLVKLNNRLTSLRVSRDREHGFQRIVSNDFRGS